MSRRIEYDTVQITGDRLAETSGTQARHSSPPIRIVEKGPEKPSSRRRDVDSSDYTDDDSEFGRDRPARRPSRSHGVSKNRGRLDTPFQPGEPHDRDSGYYGSTAVSAYPGPSYYPWDSSHYAGYPGYAGPGQMIPAPYTAPSQRPDYRHDRPAITAQEGTVVVRKTKLPGAVDKADATGISSLNDIDAVWNISSARDITLHLELDVEDDIDANLKEFTSFTRRGDYKRAEQYYQDNLSSHSEQPKVIVEYVRMLVEKGSYNSIQDLGIDDAHLTEICHSSSSPHTSEAVQLLLLMYIARTWTGADTSGFHIAVRAVMDYLYKKYADRDIEDQPFDHAEIQALSLYAIMAQNFASQVWIERRQILTRELEDALSDRLKNTYQKLLTEGNVWDIRDLIVSATILLGSQNTLSEIFPATSTEDALHRLVAEWGMTETNELSNLALLDILNAIAGATERSITVRPFAVTIDEDNSTAQTASDLARAVANSIRGSSPALMKSRSYLEWLLNEELRDRTRAQGTRTTLLTGKAVKSFPGTVLETTDTFVYVPRNSENPGWPVSYPSGSNNESITSWLIVAALKAARELGSYKLETRCLLELVCRAEKPGGYLAELENIFTSLSGDRLGLLKTRLMKYLTVANSDDATRQKLKSQLVELDPRLQSVWRNFSDILWEWAYRRVLFALMASLGEGDTEQAALTDQQGQALEFRLPIWVQKDDGPNASYHEAIAKHGATYAAMHNAPPPPPPPPPPPTEAPPGVNRSLYAYPERARSRRDEPEERKRFSREAPRFTREAPDERDRTERRKLVGFDDEAKPSRSMERTRPESKDIGPGTKDVSKIKKSLQPLEEERRKQNELIKKRAEEEVQKERVEEIRARAHEEMARIYEERARIDEKIKLEKERIRLTAEREAIDKLAMEEKERAKRRAMEEEMRARAAAEIRLQIRREEEAKAAARAREEVLIQQAKEEAKRELELQRRAEEEAAAAKAAIYSEAATTAKRELLDELKARVPGKVLRTMLGIPDGEDSDADGRLIEEVHQSDSDRSRSTRPYTRRPRRFPSASSPSSSGADSQKELEWGALSKERQARINALRKECGLDPIPPEGPRPRSRVSNSTDADTESEEDRREPRKDRDDDELSEEERRELRKDRDDDESSNGVYFDGPDLPRRIPRSDDEEDHAEASSEVLKGKGKEKEVANEDKAGTVFEFLEQDEPPAPLETEPQPAAAAEHVPAPQAQSATSSPATSPTSPQEPASPAAKIRDSNKRAMVADESEEEAHEHGVVETGKETVTTEEAQEKQHNSGDDDEIDIYD